MSRTSEVFRKLFEQEIPEVFDGLIMVKGRIPGEKKVKVDT
jgi:N utilization substance protein A